MQRGQFSSHATLRKMVYKAIFITLLAFFRSINRFVVEMSTTEVTNGALETTKFMNASGNDAQIAVPVFFAICFIVGVMGNSLVITVMIKIHSTNGRRLRNTNIFILNLAVADMFFLVMCIPFQATIYILPEWPFGSFLCYFSKFCEHSSKIVSAFSLVALSFDRWRLSAIVVVMPSITAWIQTVHSGILPWRTQRLLTRHFGQRKMPSGD